MMGRKVHQRHSPQRTNPIANREQRQTWSQHAFALFRPLSPESSASLYELTSSLQREEDIPRSIGLYNTDQHSSLIQERRMRKSLITGFVAEFAVGTTLAQLENGLSPDNASNIPFTYKSADVIGRNRNVIIARIVDKEGVLGKQRRAMQQILKNCGLTIDIDRCDHVTLGESEQGLTATEKKHVIHVLNDTLPAISGELLPIMVEHGGKRTPLVNGNRPKMDDTFYLDT